MLYFGRSPWMLQVVFALRQAVFVEEQHIPIEWELLHYLEMRGIQEGALQSVLSAEIDACAFYESCGYQKTSEPYAEDGVLCVEMTKQLKTAVKEE